MAETTIFNIAYIVKTPDIVGGKPRIEGTRISVPFIVDLHIRQEQDVNEIARQYDLSPAQIHAALAYYYDHQDEIDTILAEEDRFEAEHVDPKRQAAMRRKADEKLADQSTDEREMTATEIAEEFGITTRAVRKAADKGLVRARKSGATWLIRYRDARDYWGQASK